MKFVQKIANFVKYHRNLQSRFTYSFSEYFLFILQLYVVIYIFLSIRTTRNNFMRFFYAVLNSTTNVILQQYLVNLTHCYIFNSQQNYRLLKTGTSPILYSSIFGPILMEICPNKYLKSFGNYISIFSQQCIYQNQFAQLFVCIYYSWYLKALIVIVEYILFGKNCLTKTQNIENCF